MTTDGFFYGCDRRTGQGEDKQKAVAVTDAFAVPFGIRSLQVHPAGCEASSL